MVGCIDYNHMLDVSTFYIDEVADLDKLPTLTKNGKEELKNVNTCKVGSSCICKENGELYFLTGNDTWEIFE